MKVADICVLHVTIVGEAILDDVQMILEELNLVNPVNQVNAVNRGTLGNFKTFTYDIPIALPEVTEKRRAFMEKVQRESTKLLALYTHGDWMQVYVFRRSAFKRHSRRKHTL